TLDGPAQTQIARRARSGAHPPDPRPFRSRFPSRPDTKWTHRHGFFGSACRWARPARLGCLKGALAVDPCPEGAHTHQSGAPPPGLRRRPCLADGGNPVPEPVSPLMLEFLAWVASRPRTYDEARDAWRTTCPRHTVWEDALIEGLIQVATRG